MNMDQDVKDNMACMICDSKKDLGLLNSKLLDQKNCSEMFQICFNLNFPKKNKFGFFNMICSQCTLCLKKSYEFRKQSEIAHQRLYAHIIKFNDEIKVTTISSENYAIKPEFIVETEHIKTEKTYLDNGDFFEDLIEDINQMSTQREKKRQRDESTRKKNRNIKKKFSFDQPVKIMDVIQKRLQNTNTVVKRVKSKGVGKGNDEDRWSDWSTNTEEILIATGFYNQKKIKQSEESVRINLKEGSLKCPICGEEFMNYNITHMHYVTHYPEALCHLCGKTIASKYGLISHMRTHEKKTNDYVCELCNKVFKTQHTQRAHVKFTHKGVKAVKCYHCPMKFSGSLSRLIHMHKTHGIPCKFFSCNQCELKFYTKTRLKIHSERVHAKKANFFCDKCPGAFVLKYELRNHITYKHGDKSNLPHCELCGKSFASPKGLKEHMKIHLNIKNYKCTYCDQAFVQKPSLVCHLKKHQPAGSKSLLNN